MTQTVTPLPPQRDQLASRIGRVHLRQRLGIEQVYESKVFGQGRNLLHLENLKSFDKLLALLLKATFLFNRGRSNARGIVLRENIFALPNLPRAFDGFRLLHVSDLHLDMASDIPAVLIEAVKGLEFDCCVLTGDFRAETFGEFADCCAALARVRPHLGDKVYGVLGNHDSIQMVPAIEELGINLLLNEYALLERDDAALYLAGVDDPHYFRADNLEKAADAIPEEAVSILLSHSPEIYKNALHAAFDIMLCGHTHGGQICLPGGFPLYLNANCRRSVCRGAWEYHGMQGYTSAGSGSSILDVRFNCPPEIVVHTLVRS
ncbi:MAG: metallophosphoesterase family protein [Gammaproteobacteria bacterium]|nr:metallophosphoesterase family protein [Gammaproteobacteria bacterium]NNF61066.1 metallophosphoesterase [Gammaproteobacteria bacterium]NNM21421.1 metallophosphoesterase [Gammaproteobacteria bacterium]